MKYVITVTAENNPQGLYRIIGIFVRRKISINKLSQSLTKTKGMVKININIHCEETVMYTISKQINRIIEVRSVKFKKNISESE